MVFVSAFFVIVAAFAFFVKLAMRAEHMDLSSGQALLEFAVICAIALSLAMYLHDD